MAIDINMSDVAREIGALGGGGVALIGSAYLASLFLTDLVPDYPTIILSALCVFSLTFLGGWTGAKSLEWAESYLKSK